MKTEGSRVKRNIVANLAGSTWTALVGLIFIPLYIHLIGIEGYGLVGIFATLQAIFEFARPRIVRRF